MSGQLGMEMVMRRVHVPMAQSRSLTHHSVQVELPVAESVVHELPGAHWSLDGSQVDPVGNVPADAAHCSMMPQESAGSM